jgi:hypothetical protein
MRVCPPLCTTACRRSTPRQSSRRPHMTGGGGGVEGGVQRGHSIRHHHDTASHQQSRLQAAQRRHAARARAVHGQALASTLTVDFAPPPSPQNARRSSDPTVEVRGDVCGKDRAARCSRGHMARSNCHTTRGRSRAAHLHDRVHHVGAAAAVLPHALHVRTETSADTVDGVILCRSTPTHEVEGKVTPSTTRPE